MNLSIFLFHTWDMLDRRVFRKIGFIIISLKRYSWDYLTYTSSVYPVKITTYISW